MERKDQIRMGKLTTHILDTAAGVPGGNIRIVVTRLEPDHQLVADVVSNGDGRTDSPILDGSAFTAGVYQLEFHVGEYYKNRGLSLPEPAFLDIVTLRVGLADASQNYHVPLLVSPFGYSTYRGS